MKHAQLTHDSATLSSFDLSKLSKEVDDLSKVSRLWVERTTALEAIDEVNQMIAEEEEGLEEALEVEVEVETEAEVEVEAEAEAEAEAGAEAEAEAEASSENLEFLHELTAELSSLTKSAKGIESRLLRHLLPVDPSSLSPVILEIRAGTGGDEASAFASELLNAYERYARDEKGWGYEILEISRNEYGGVKEAVVSVEAKGGGGGSYDNDNDNDNLDDNLGVYGLLKWESGVHRVQRVPSNSTKLHTSAVSVAVLPAHTNDSSDIKDVDINPGDLKIDVFRASGAGGQHVNTTESAVRITHLPTGVVAACQDERSQHKNKDKAMKVLRARMFDQIRVKEMSLQSDARAAVMGSGDRSERVRTYNFRDDRCTDHRTKVSVFGLKELVGNGGVVEAFGRGLREKNVDDVLMAVADEEEGGGGGGRTRRGKLKVARRKGKILLTSRDDVRTNYESGRLLWQS